jgi:hypothetical protein
MKYFGFVGSALVLLLLAMNWLLPEPASEPIHGNIERPVIRISSMETPPERVVFDTNMPPPVVPRITVQPPQSALTFEQLTPGVSPTFSTVAQVVPKKPITVKRDPARMVANHRVLPQVHTTAAKNYSVRESEPKPSIKTTLLDDIAGRFEQIFKVN